MKIITHSLSRVKLTKHDKRILATVLTLMIFRPESILPVVAIALGMTFLAIGTLELLDMLRYFFQI